MDNSDKVKHILIVEDPSFRKTISLDGATYSLGRHSSNDIVFSCQKTSRHHATLLRRTDVKTNEYSYWILDGDLQGNRSRNGIFVNGKRTLVHELKPGDTIKFSSDAKAKYHIVSNFGEISDDSARLVFQEDLVDRALIDRAKTVVNKDTLSPSTELHEPSQSFDDSQIFDRQTSVAELNPQPIIEIDLEGKITYVNSAAALAFKDIYQQENSHPLLNDLISQDRNQNQNSLTREVQVGERFFQQKVYYLPEERIIRSYILDITEQKTLAKQLQGVTAMYQNIIKQVVEGIVIVDGATKKIVEVNQECSNLLGYSVESLLKMSVYELCLEAEKFAIILQKIVTENSSFSGGCLLRHQDGTIINGNLRINLINGGEIECFCIVIYRSLEYNRFPVDSLAVDLTRRDIFREQLTKAIANAKRNQKLLGVMFFNLDFLPNIRDTVGYEKSSRLISNLGERLKSCLRSGDTVTHWKEDQFALLMPQIGGIEEVARISQRIQTSLEQSFKIGDNQFSVQSNIGIAIYPQDGTEIDILIDNAQVALLRARRSNSNYQFYNSTMNSQAAVMLELENLLHHALEKKEFKLYYQPQINVKNGNIQGIEALLRWEHPELGLVSPTSFLKLAEQTGLIIPIGEWVLRTACSQNKAWQAQGIPPLRVSVNISPVQFQQPNLPTLVKQILTETKLEPHLLELEIAAGALIENVEYGHRILRQLKDLGVYISVDDVATGLASLEHLKQFPFDTLKIDRSYVQELTSDPQDLAVVSALVELGKGFDLRVVAEGVETQQQIELLRSLNCEQMQGFWFSRPLGVEEATKLLPFNYDRTPDSDSKS